MRTESGIALTALFNSNGDASDDTYRLDIQNMFWEAIGGVKQWPAGDQFNAFP